LLNGADDFRKKINFEIKIRNFDFTVFLGKVFDCQISGVPTDFAG